MSAIESRLKSALKFDVLNGDASERAILAQQIAEAISVLSALRRTNEVSVSAMKFGRQFYQDNFDNMPVSFQTVDNELEHAIEHAEKNAQR